MKKSKLLLSSLAIPVTALGFIPLVSCNSTQTPNFSTDSWFTVVDLCNQGLGVLKDHYKIQSFVGLERKIIINGLAHTVKVIGENEDFQCTENTEGEIVPDYHKPVALTFQFDTVISTFDEDEGEIIPVEIPFCNINEETGMPITSWKWSRVKDYLNNDEYSVNDDQPFIQQLTNQLGPRAIKEVCKTSFNTRKSENLTYDDETTLESSAEKVFIPSLGDIYTGEDNFPTIPDDWDWEHNDYLSESNLGQDGKTHAYSYYHNILSDKFAYSNPIKSLVLTDYTGLSQDYWLRSGILNDIDVETLEVDQWSMTVWGDCCAGGDMPTPIQSELALAPIFCI